MKNHYRLFTEVAPFYQDLLARLQEAQESISMMYLIYDAGEWAGRFNQVLMAKSKAGVKVRIMADLFGTLIDHPSHIHKNLAMLKELEEAGIEINLFQQAGPRSSPMYRLHFKLCAIDQGTVFIGGSNIGDYYTRWQDSNLRIDGEIGTAGHDLYDYMAARSTQGQEKYCDKLDAINPSTLWFGEAQVLLTLPGSRKDICRHMLDLLLGAEDTVYFRHWYFLPNKEFLNAMLSQLERGVQIQALLSDRTRVPVIDIANHVAIKKLVRCGAKIFRYHSRYMHSKITWSQRGDIIFGSCNLEEKGLSNNFELCVQIEDPALGAELTSHFKRDCAISDHQTPCAVKKRPVIKRALAHVLVYATPLL